MTDKQLVSVTLQAGICPSCQQPLKEKRADKDLPLGATCQLCMQRDVLVRTFGPDNIDIKATPPKGWPHPDEYSFLGTRVAINGQIATICSVQADFGWVVFPGDDPLPGTPIFGLGYYELCELQILINHGP